MSDTDFPVELPHQKHEYELPEAQALVKVSIQLLGPEGAEFQPTQAKIKELYPWIDTNLNVVAALLRQIHQMCDGTWTPPQGL